ncbi:formylglycine-generating enzyme family protein [Candidatus Poribacteria bacterium]
MHRDYYTRVTQRLGDANYARRIFLCLRVPVILCFVLVVSLSSCLTLAPPQDQMDVGKEETEQKVSSSRSKQVMWKNVKVSKPISSMATEKASQQIVPAQAGNASPPGMALIPADEFLMGSKMGEGNSDEDPQHKVHLDAYYIDIHEVTNAQYYQFWSADGGEKSKHTPASYGGAYKIGDWPEVAKTKPNYPVVGITWYDASAYAEWVGKRLPTEAEWEKAAREATVRTWPWGDDFNLEIPVTEGESQRTHSNRRDGDDGYDNTTAPVASYPTGASPYGVHDMAGNVWEWVVDWYDEDYYGSSPTENPKGPDAGKLKVARGGSWNNREHDQRCANRYYSYPDSWGNTLGFRCAKSVTRNEE